jgi:hypothetical protein
LIKVRAQTDHRLGRHVHILLNSTIWLDCANIEASLSAAVQEL